MTTSAPPLLRPAPTIDRDSAFFWEGLRERELRLQRCQGCGRRRSPPLPACPYCGNARSDVEVSPGLGALYTYVVVRHAFSPVFEADVPYTVGVVELDEGCRMLARLELGATPPDLGVRVRVAYRDHPAEGEAADAGQGGWTEAYFVAAGATAVQGAG